MGAYERALSMAIVWSRTTFPDATLKSTVEHLRREVQELADEPDSAEEMADCAILLAHAKSRLDDIAEDHNVNLPEAVREKLSVLRKRKWGEPDSDGVIEHVREGK